MVRLACLITLLLASPVLAVRPNVVVILADDQGWGDLSRSAAAPAWAW